MTRITRIFADKKHKRKICVNPPNPCHPRSKLLLSVHFSEHDIDAADVDENIGFENFARHALN